MFRFVVLAVTLLAFPAWADYQLNISVLDSLTMEQAPDDLPLIGASGCPLPAPTAKPNKQSGCGNSDSITHEIKPQKRNTIKVDEQSSVRKNDSAPKVSTAETKPETSPYRVSAPFFEDIVETPAETATSVAKTQPAEPVVEKTSTDAPLSKLTTDSAVETIAPLVAVDDKMPAEVVEKLFEKEHSENSVAENKEQKEIELSVAPATLIPFNNNSVNSVQIIFDDNSDVLSDKAISELDAFVEKNKDDFTGKILIEAYHYNSDNGFARKRTSLNRAVNIRSYLLNRGFKSFNIQIINTEEEVLQNNTVVSR